MVVAVADEATSIVLSHLSSFVRNDPTGKALPTPSFFVIAVATAPSHKSRYNAVRFAEITSLTVP